MDFVSILYVVFFTCVGYYFGRRVYISNGHEKVVYPARNKSRSELEKFVNEASVLPMIVDDMEEIKEVIICDSISGGAAYQNEMPEQLHLTRMTKDGKELRCLYVQKVA